MAAPPPPATADTVSQPDDDVWMISVDDHVVEPPDLWTSRLPARMRDRGPQVIEVDGAELWEFGDRRKTCAEMGARLFRPELGKRDLFDIPRRFDELRPGCADPRARALDLDVAHVEQSLCFPSFPRFCGQEFTECSDRDLGAACVRAYNDWMIDDWCASVPGRFIPLVILPMWDPVASVAEIERCAARGARAVAFSENPAMLGLPSIHDRSGFWDPVFAACSDAQLVVCCHIGSSSKMFVTADDAPPLVTATLPSYNSASALADWFWSGQFVRHPDLVLCLSEGGIGWMPALVERADYVFDRYADRMRSGVGFALTGLSGGGDYNEGAFDARPSELFRRHVVGCFIEDVHGARNIDAIGVDNVMCETDYPHGDTSWPHSRTSIAAQIGHLTPGDQRKVLRDNAIRVFHLDA